MPAQRDAEWARRENHHRQTVKYILRRMPIEHVNHLFEIHSADNAEPGSDPELFLDTIDAYLDRLYFIPPK